MDALRLHKQIKTHKPVVTIAPLPVGLYRVQLVVQGHSGKSLPATLVIRVSKE